MLQIDCLEIVKSILTIVANSSSAEHFAKAAQIALRRLEKSQYLDLPSWIQVWTRIYNQRYAKRKNFVNIKKGFDVCVEDIFLSLYVPDIELGEALPDHLSIEYLDREYEFRCTENLHGKEIHEIFEKCMSYLEHKP
ncbi:MAG: hypothetical protein PHN19_03520 [Patescibacteria group bacterium]|nr:hypothetical protein [Patescibacteria group bacterium]